MDVHHSNPMNAGRAASPIHSRALSVEPVDFATLQAAMGTHDRQSVWRTQAAMDVLRGMDGTSSFDATGGFLARTAIVTPPASLATTAIMAKRLVSRLRSKKAVGEVDSKAGAVAGDSGWVSAEDSAEGSQSDYEGDEEDEGWYSADDSEEELVLESGDEFEDGDGAVWVYSARDDAWTCQDDEGDFDEYELDSDCEDAEALAEAYRGDPEAPPPAAPRPPAPPAVDTKAVRAPHAVAPPPPQGATVPRPMPPQQYVPPAYYTQYQQREVMNLFAAGASAPSPRSMRQARQTKTGPGTLHRQGTSAVGTSADVDVAHNHAHYMHPRVLVDGVPRKFPIFSTPAGRHCFRCVDNVFCCNMCGDTTSASYLAEFGPGISLYFKYVKWLTWVFIILSLLHTPAMVLNAVGPGATLGTAVGDLGVHSLTLGNLGDSRNVTAIFLPGTSCGSEQCSLTKSDVAVLYSACALGGVLVLLVAYVWLRLFEAREQPLVDQDYITVDDFAIAVRPLPAAADDISLKRHFERVTGQKVVDVNVARDEGKLVRLAEQRGAQIKQLVEAEEEFMGAKAGNDAAAMRGIQARKAKIRLMVNKIDAAIASERERHVGVLAQQARAGTPALLKSKSGLKGRWRGRGRALGAFVVFETEKGRQKALDLYRGSNLWCLRVCQSERLRYRPALRMVQGSQKLDLPGAGSAEACACCWRTASGKTPLRVLPAPDPSSIQWKNLGANAWNRAARRGFTTLFALLAIAFSFGLLVWASFRQQQARETGGEAECPADRVVTLEEMQADRELLHCYCSGLGTQAVVRDSNCRGWVSDRSLAVLVQGLSSVSVVAVNLFLSTLMKRLTQFEKHHSKDSQSMSLSVRLFASQFINTALVTLFINADWTAIGLPITPISQQYDDFTSPWYATVGAGIILTMLMNIISPHAFPLARWAQRRCMTRVALGEPFFYCPSCIMRCLCLCCCPRCCCGVLKDIPVSTVRQRQEAFCCARVCKPLMPSHQDKLNRMFVGPEFRLSVRYAQLTNTIFVTLMFASGMPILLPIAAVSFLVSFYVDKFLFLRFYRKPPHYDSQMGMSMSGLVPYAILLHLGTSAWMFSNRAIFSSQDYVVEQVQAGALSAGGPLRDATLTYSDRLSQLHVVPFVLLFCVLALFLLALAVLDNFSTAAGRCLSVVSCGYCQAHADFMNQLAANKTPLSYTQAITPGRDGSPPRMIGTLTYNILHQPQFQDKFALSAAFVQNANFKNVSDIQHNPLPDEAQLRRQIKAAKATVSKQRNVRRRDVSKQLKAQKLADVRDRAVAAELSKERKAKKSRKGRKR